MKELKMTNKRKGSSIDALLREEGLLDEMRSVAIKEVTAWRLGQAMKQRTTSTGERAKKSLPGPKAG
jgi:antitoxin HicB